MLIQSRMQVGAIFQLTSFKADGAIKEESAPFCNMVLDSGLNRMGLGGYFNAVAVGTGNSEPIASQTALDNRIANTTLEQGNFSIAYQSTPTPCYILTRKYRFNAGVAAGNLSEVSLGWMESTTFKSWNRALIKDINGNPTTMTILSDEYLDVTGSIYYYPNIVDVTQTVNMIDGSAAVINPVEILVRPALLGSFNPPGQYNSSYPPPYIFDTIEALVGQNNWMRLLTGDIGTITGEPTGTSLAVTSWGSSNLVELINDIYVNGSYKRSGKFIIKLNAGNGEIKSMLLKTTLGCYQAQFTPPIVKQNTKILTIPIELSWGRYEPT